MKNFNLIKQIIDGKWLIDEKFVINSLPLIHNLLTGKTVFEADEIDLKPKAVSATGFRSYNWDEAPEGSVGIIKVHGSLTKENQCCGPIGMATIGAIIKNANARQNISSIVLDIDSPGGTVDGTIELANIIKYSKKPIVAFYNGMACSAALWIGSSASKAIAATDFTEVGSVGVLMSFWDIIGHFEKKGYKFHKIVSSLSPDKVKLFDDLREGKYDDYRKNNLDPIAEEFQKTIKENLPNVTDDHIKGKVFFAKDVISILVNSIGTIEDAIIEADNLAKSNLNNNQNSNTMKLKSIPKVLGTELESVEGHVSLNEEQINQIEQALVDADANATNLDSITQERDAAMSERDDAIQQRDNNAQTIEQLNNTISDLEAKIPGAGSARDLDKGKEKDDASEDTVEAEMAKLDEMDTPTRVAYLKSKGY